MKHIIFIALLSYSLIGVGQDTVYHYSVGTINEENAIRVFSTSAGFVFFGSTGTSGRSSDIIIISTDRTLSTIDVSTIGDGGVNYLIDVLEISDKRFVLASQVYSGFGNSDYNVQLQIIDSNYSVVETQTLDKIGVENPKALGLYDNHIYLLLESVDQSNTRYSMLVFDLNLEESSSFELPEIDSLNYESMHVDSIITLVGNTTGAVSMALLSQFNQTGSHIRQLIFSRNGHETLNDIFQESDSSFIVTGTTLSDFGDDTEVFVFSVSDDLDTLWQSTHGWNPNFDNKDEVGVKTVRGGQYLYSGSNTETYGAGKSDFHVYKLDTLGGFVAGRSYGLKEDETLKDIIMVNDSTILLYGNSESKQIGLSDLFIVLSPVLFDGLARKFTVNSQQVDSTLGIKEYEKGDLTVINNGGDPVLIFDTKLKSCELAIRNLQGQLVMQTTIMENRFSFTGFNQGLYVTTCSCGDRVYQPIRILVK